MSFLDWISMSILVDISFLVFAVAAVWKIRKLDKKINQTQNDLLVTMKNPAAAKRLLKERLK